MPIWLLFYCCVLLATGVLGLSVFVSGRRLRRQIDDVPLWLELTRAANNPAQLEVATETARADR